MGLITRIFRPSLVRSIRSKEDCIYLVRQIDQPRESLSQRRVGSQTGVWGNGVGKILSITGSSTQFANLPELLGIERSDEKKREAKQRRAEHNNAPVFLRERCVYFVMMKLRTKLKAQMQGKA